MICKHCGLGIPASVRNGGSIEVNGIGAFHEHCITPEQATALERRIDDVKRWAIDVGIIRIHADHDRERTHAPTA